MRAHQPVGFDAFAAKISYLPPTVTTVPVTDIGTSTATDNGNITDLGYSNPTAHGLCWSTSANPTTSDSNKDNGPASATGAFTANITGLSEGMT